MGWADISLHFWGLARHDGDDADAEDDDDVRTDWVQHFDISQPMQFSFYVVIVTPIRCTLLQWMD